MGLTHEVGRLAARHAHVLLVEVPGHWRTRAAIETAALTRGWTLATSPADADLLAVCGKAGPELGDAIETVWSQMPGPRVRVDVGEDDAQACLGQAHAVLLDTEHHRHDAQTREVVAASHGDMDHGDMDHGDMDHGDMDHGDMDHGDMDMSPSGIPLAQGAEDRDGLEMDVLNVRLGPVLPHWPAGLVLRCALHGDVVADAQAEVLDVQDQQPEDDRNSGPARTLDNVVSLLALAGWHGDAGRARRIRDGMLGGGDPAATKAQLQRLVLEIKRSRLLRWSLRGIRPLGPEQLRHQELPLRLGGDTYDRLLGMLERVDNDDSGTAAFQVDLLPHVVAGLDLSAARLVIASLDLQTLRADHAHSGMSHA